MSQIFGGGGGSGLVIEVNGVSVTLQTLLNMIAGTNINIVSDAFGGVTFSASISNIPSVQQSASGSSGSASSLGVAFSSGNTAGNSIIVIAQWQGSAMTMSVADSNVNTYASLRGPDTNGADSASGARQQIWLATGILAGANTVTVTPSANTPMMLIILECVNLALLDTLDTTSWNDSVTTTTSLSSGSATTHQDVQLLITYGGTESQAATLTPAAGWTVSQNTTDTPNAQAFFSAYKVTTTAGNYSATATASPATTYGMGLVTLRSSISSTSPNASVATFTTSSLATNATQTGNVTIAKMFALMNVRVSQAARLRLYVNAAAQTADLGRSNQVPPTPGTQSGVICDLYLDTNDKFTWQMTPTAIGYNWDTPQGTAIYYTVTNLGTTGSVTVTMTFVPMES